MGTEKNSLNETVLLSTQNICSQVYINRTFQLKIVKIFLPISFNICFGSSIEQSHGDGSFEYPQKYVLAEK